MPGASARAGRALTAASDAARFAQASLSRHKHLKEHGARIQMLQYWMRAMPEAEEQHL